MLDLKRISESFDDVEERTLARGGAFPADDLRALIAERRDAIYAHETARAAQKSGSERMRSLKPGSEEFLAERESLRAAAEEVKRLDEVRRGLEEKLREVLLTLPNLIDPEVPRGTSEADNVVVRTWGEVRSFDFSVEDHVSLAERHGWLELEPAAAVSGARFAFLRGDGARLERALANFMLDLHTQEHDYEEFTTPYLVHGHALEGTGQLPKFEEDLFRSEDHFLIPTAEVPLTNFFRETLLPELSATRKLVASTPCFRREAGSHGRDTRGLIRLHQFQKVELVKICREEESAAEHEALVREACTVLERLELPYRVLELCSGDIGFSAARCFDLEVWLPSQSRWVEISSCSNCRDFQARRAQIRYRDADGKARLAHTLNGSGVAVGRAMVALLEYHQQADGRIAVPEALRPWLGGRTHLGRAREA